MEVSLLLRLFLQELLELVLLLVDLEAVHIVLAICVGVQLIVFAASLVRPVPSGTELGPLEVVIERLVLSILEGRVVGDETKLLDEELLDLHVRDG